MHLLNCTKSLEGKAPSEGAIWVRMVWELDGAAAAVCRSRFVDADDASALLNVLKAILSAGKGYDTGDINPRPLLKYF